MDKQEVVAVLQRLNHVVGMTGDGVNDAPAFSQAQIGIAVCGATDAAKTAGPSVVPHRALLDMPPASSPSPDKRCLCPVLWRPADILLTQPGLAAIYNAVIESRRIFRRLRTYIIYRMGATIQIVLFLSLIIFIWNELLAAVYVILLVSLPPGTRYEMIWPRCIK